MPPVILLAPAFAGQQVVAGCHGNSPRIWRRPVSSGIRRADGIVDCAECVAAERAVVEVDELDVFINGAVVKMIGNSDRLTIERDDEIAGVRRPAAIAEAKAGQRRTGRLDEDAIGRAAGIIDGVGAVGEAETVSVVAGATVERIVEAPPTSRSVPSPALRMSVPPKPNSRSLPVLPLSVLPPASPAINVLTPAAAPPRTLFAGSKLLIT